MPALSIFLIFDFIPKKLSPPHTILLPHLQITTIIARNILASIGGTVGSIRMAIFTSIIDINLSNWSCQTAWSGHFQTRSIGAVFVVGAVKEPFVESFWESVPPVPQLKSV